jgi:hypothetical protein
MMRHGPALPYNTSLRLLQWAGLGRHEVEFVGDTESTGKSFQSGISNKPLRESHPPFEQISKSCMYL